MDVRIWAVSYTHLDVYKRQVDPLAQGRLESPERLLAL